MRCRDAVNMAPSVKLAIVVAEFNRELTEGMLKQALKRSAQLKAMVSYVCKVPGSYDMPLIIQTMLKKDDVDAVVTLGAIVKGETKHDEVIAHAIAAKIIQLSLQYEKPVTLGVSGPGMSWQEAKARVNEYPNRSVNAAVEMVLRQREAKRKRSRNHTLVIE